MSGSPPLPRWTRKLCLALRENKPTLVKLDLHVGFTVDDRIAIALAEALQSNSTVTEINFRLDCVQMDGIGRLGEMLAKNKTIAMIRVDSDTKTGLCHVFILRGPYRYSMAGIVRGLVNNTSVADLTLQDNGIGDEEFESAMKELVKTNQRSGCCGLPSF